MGKMTDNMVERVARAICNAGMPNDHWQDIDRGRKDDYREEARAAIEAMLEPTEQMLSWGADEVSNEYADGCRQSHREVAHCVYRSMIDVALRAVHG